MAAVTTADPLPEAWRRTALAAGCPEPARGWTEDRGPAPDAGRDARALAESEAAIALSAAALGRFFPVLD
jgi:hypothetical protein